jgi:hypothetical protein
MAQMKVFVSHSHTNNAFCAELVQGLKAAGADVWYDEEQLHAGQLGPVIECELHERPVFVMCSPPPRSGPVGWRTRRAGHMVN